MSIGRTPYVLFRVLLFLACVFAVWVISPTMPGDGLDPSWRHGINEAVAQGWVFGRDLVFTFGPFGALYTGVYHPSTDLQTVLASFWLGLAFGGAALRVTQAAHWLVVLGAAVVLSGLIFLRDPLFFCYPLLVGVVCLNQLHREAVPEMRHYPVPQLSGTVELGLLFAPFGLLMLVKGSSTAQCALVVLASAVLLCFARQWGRVAMVVLAPSISLFALWLLSGQDPMALPAYLSAMSSVTAGYSEAMASPGPSGEIRLFLLTAVILFAVVARQRQHGLGHRVYLGFVLGITLLVAFKGGFVRHDGHATMASVTLLLCALFLWGAARSPLLLLGVLLAVLTWWRIDQHHMHSTPASVLQTVSTTWTEPFAASLRRWQSPQRLHDDYQATLAQVRASRPLPILPGTVDIYSFDQTQLLASGNRWHPRPVFQSYQAYSPELLQRNRDHLSGAQAPDHIFFRIEPIDNRLPSTEDGLSWPLLLWRYAPRQLDSTTLVLDRDQGRSTASFPMARVEGRLHRLGEEVAVPQDARSVMLELDIRPTLIGRLITLLYKPSPLFLTLTLADGSRRSFRLVSGMARSGFLVSPLVENVDDFMALSVTSPVPDVRRVTHVSLAPSSRRWQWQRHYEVRFVALQP